MAKTPGRRTKRTPAHSISSSITNGSLAGSRRLSYTDTASQNSATLVDDQDLEVDENSFYIHLQKMQERYKAQQEPGWLRTQHAILQAKHKIPGASSPQLEQKSSFGRKSGLISGSPFLSRMHSNGSSPGSADYSSSPSFHPGLYSSRQPHSGLNSQRNQPIQPYNCFQPGNVICVPRERSLNGLIFHRSFVGKLSRCLRGQAVQWVDCFTPKERERERERERLTLCIALNMAPETHILTPSPYYRGQFLTMDHKVVEIDMDHIKEISGMNFDHGKRQT
jgi:hypothetical protein